MRQKGRRVDSAKRPAAAAAAAPVEYKEGDQLDVWDQGDQSWYITRVLSVTSTCVKVHYEGWHTKHDKSLSPAAFARLIAPLHTHTEKPVPEPGCLYVSEFSCSICGDGGDVLCCDSCPRVWHMTCLQMTQEPDSFKCSYCVLKRDSSGGAAAAAATPTPARADNDADSTFSNDSDEPTILDSRLASSSAAAAAASSSSSSSAAMAAAAADDGSCRVCHAHYPDVACGVCHAAFHAICVSPTLHVDPAGFMCKECLIRSVEAPMAATPSAAAAAAASAGAGAGGKKKGASSAVAAAAAADKRPSRKKSKPHQHLPAFINASTSAPPPAQPQLHDWRRPSDGAAAASRAGIVPYALTSDGCALGHKRKPKPRLRSENVQSLGILLRAIHYDFVHKPKKEPQQPATTGEAASATALAKEGQKEEKKQAVDHDGLAPMELDGPAEAEAATVPADSATPAAAAAAASSSPVTPAAAAAPATMAPAALPSAPPAPPAPSLRALLSRGGCSCTSLFHSPGSPRPLLSALDVASCQARLLTAHEQHRDLVFKLERHVEACDVDWQEAVSQHLKRMFPAQAKLIAAQSEAELSHVQLLASEMDSAAVPPAVAARIAANIARLTPSPAHDRVRSALAAISELDAAFQGVKSRFRRSFDRPFRAFEEHDRYYQILDDARLYLLTMHPLDRNDREVALPKDAAGRTVDPPPLEPPLAAFEWQAVLEEWWAEVRALQSDSPSHSHAFAGSGHVPPAAAFSLGTPAFDPRLLCFRCEALCADRDDLAKHMEEQHWKGDVMETATASAAQAAAASGKQNGPSDGEHKEAATTAESVGATAGQKRKQASSPSPASASASSSSSSSSLVQQLLSRSEAALSADPAFLSTLSAHLSSPETALRFERLLREVNQQQLQQQASTATAASATDEDGAAADGPAKRARISADTGAASAASAAPALAPAAAPASSSSLLADSSNSTASNAFVAHLLDPELRFTQAQWAALQPVRNKIVGELFW